MGTSKIMIFIDVNKDFDNEPGYTFAIPGVRLPEIKIPPEQMVSVGLKGTESNYEFLRALARKGFRDLKLKSGTPEHKKYSDRAKLELEVLEELGFTDYVLLVLDIINFCKKNDIPLGLGRGSVCSSLLMYLIGVTGIDSIKYELYFERFVSKVRAKKTIVDGIIYLDGKLLCDIDIDLDLYRRGEVIEYIKEKYSGNVCNILRFNTLSGKLVIKECGKVVGEKSETEMKSVADQINRIFGKVEDLEHAYKNDKHPKFKEWVDQNKESYDIALKLSNLIKNKGVHPSGVLISYNKLSDCIATELSVDKNIVSSVDMNFASLIAVKVDCLGLKNVSIVKSACDDLGLKMEKINVEDPFIYQQYQDLKYRTGLFQIEADTNYKVLRSVKPKNLEELSAVLGLARPGALSFVDQYSKYVNNGIYTEIDPLIDSVLKPTGGICIYQESTMQLFTKIGFSLLESETIRRIIGKKSSEEVKEWKEKIYQKCRENNIDVKVADLVWFIADQSSSYSFNKSHSIAYSTLTAITTYLKFKYPKNFFLALLRASKNDPDPRESIEQVAQELEHFKIKLLPPDINKSELDFSIEGDNIRFGISSIKGIGRENLEKFASFKNKDGNKFQKFQSFKEAKIGIGVVSSLIQSGAVPEFKDKRSFGVLEAQLWGLLNEKERDACLLYGKENDFALIKTIKFLETKNNEKGKPIISARRLATIRKKYALYREIYEKNRENEKFANWFYEKKLMGYSSGVTLKEIFSEKHHNLVTISEALSYSGNDPIKFVGQVQEKYLGTSKKGDKYLRLSVKDDGGMISCLAFKDAIDEIKTINGEKLPAEDNIVIVHGRRKNDAIFIDHISIQDSKIYIKLGELRDEIKEKNEEEVKSITPH